MNNKKIELVWTNPHQPELEGISLDATSLHSLGVVADHSSQPKANPLQARRRFCMLLQALQEIVEMIMISREYMMVYRFDSHAQIHPGGLREQVEPDAS